jgi:hypothetical protein
MPLGGFNQPRIMPEERLLPVSVLLGVVENIEEIPIRFPYAIY